MLLLGCSAHQDTDETILNGSFIDVLPWQQGASDPDDVIVERIAPLPDMVLPPRQGTLQHSVLLSQDDYRNTSSQSADWLRGGTVVTLRFRQLPLQTLADMLSQITMQNFVVESSVQDLLITASLDRLPWRDAIAIMAQTHHFDVQQARQAIMFAAVAAQNDQQGRAAGSAAAQQADMFRLAYMQPQTLKEVLEPLFKGQKSKPSFSVDQRSRSLIVKAAAEDTRLIEALTQSLDQPVRQVEIEAFIVEANEDFERSLGTRLGFRTADDSRIHLQGALNGLTVDLAVPNPSVGIAAMLDSERLRFELTALEREGKSRIVSNPRIFTLENQEAIIFQGDEVPYFSVSESGTQTEFKEAGIRLAVTPTIINEETLLLNMMVNKDTVDTRVQNPPITRRQVSTSLKVANGAVVVIGGIYLNTKVATIGRVPLFGSLPIIGSIFRQSGKNRDVRQLLIFIAPRILA